MDVTATRRRIRELFDEHVPRALAGLADPHARARAWRATLYDAGFAGLGYPIEFGGHGDQPEVSAVWNEESRRRVPPEERFFGIGVGMALPTIRDHGSDAVKERFLRPGLRGEEIWCQLYSEPGAGSDLASLRTSAVLDGDEWVVNGQKVWSSGAQNSQLGVLLARTDPGSSRHAGVSMLVMPMEQSGVNVRPLRQMTGNAEFNEVFFDDARLPATWVIGAVDDGWRTAVALLGHERVATGTASVGGDVEQRTKVGRTPIPVAQLRRLAQEQRRDDDPLVRQALARLHTGERVMGWLGQRRAHPSIGKLWRTAQGRAAAELAARLAFPASPAWDAEATASDAEVADPDYWNHHILNCRGMSIGGGTDEIQRNTLGERALGLPR